MGRLRCCLFIAVFLGVTFTHAQTASPSDDVYRGTVVDAETGEPLEGAVVVVVWLKKPWLAMDGPDYFHKAKEVMTDVGGKFSIDITPGVNWNLFTFMDEHPWIVIFKPGYGPLTPAYHRGLANFHEDLKQGAMVRLPRLKTRKELIHFADLGALGIGGDFPRRHIRNLLRLVNEQRKHLYLEPFPEAPGGRP